MIHDVCVISMLRISFAGTAAAGCAGVLAVCTGAGGGAATGAGSGGGFRFGGEALLVRARFAAMLERPVADAGQRDDDDEEDVDVAVDARVRRRDACFGGGFLRGGGGACGVVRRSRCARLSRCGRRRRRRSCSG